MQKPNCFTVSDAFPQNFSVGAIPSLHPPLLKLIAGLLSGALAASPPGVRITLVEQDFPTTTITLATPLRSTPSAAGLRALDLAAGCLSRRLHHDFAEARSLHAEDSVRAPSRSDPLLHISLGSIPRENAVFALRLALYDYARFAREGLTAEEGAGAAGAGLTLEEVNAAIRANLDPDAVSVRIDTRGAAALRDEILIGAPSPAVYPYPMAVDVLEEDILIERYPLPAAPRDVEVR